MVGFSLDATDTRRRHGIEAYAITSGPSHVSGRGRILPLRLAFGLVRRGLALAREPRHLWSSFRALRGMDYLVVAGSGQLLDQWRGPWGHPFTVFKWALLARLTRTSLMIPSVGAGPIDGTLARLFIRTAVNVASYISVRDEGSARVLHAIGVHRSLPVVPDMGFGLPLEAGRAGTRTKPSGTRPVVGVNAMAHANARYWGHGSPARYRAYIEKVASVCAGIVRDGADVVLFSSQTVADPATAEDILAALSADEVAPHVRFRTVEGHADLIDFIQTCDAVIASRYHSVLLPLRFGIPTIALAYHPKTEYLMRMAGQEEFCLDIDTFDADDLLQRSRTLWANRDEVHAALARQVPPLRAAVLDQFDLMFGKVSPARNDDDREDADDLESGRVRPAGASDPSGLDPEGRRRL